MDSPVSAQEPEHDHSPTSTPPRRLSALYQYHNAPEVAPAYGLEYDDTIYPVSDKMTIVREFPFRHHACRYSRADFDSENRPPRIIFGMKVGTFLVVACLVLLVVVGAAVGGAVGGKNLHQGYMPVSGAEGRGSGSSSNTASTTTTSTSHTPHTPTVKPYSGATPTYTPLSSCPTANATTYTSPFLLSPKLNIKQSFTMYCSLAPTQSSTKLVGAYVYSFSDCVDICAAYNYAQDTADCNVVFYEAGAARPLNCWGAKGEAIVSALSVNGGTDVGILIPLPP